MSAHPLRGFNSVTGSGGPLHPPPEADGFSRIITSFCHEQKANIICLAFHLTAHRSAEKSVEQPAAESLHREECTRNRSCQENEAVEEDVRSDGC